MSQRPITDFFKKTPTAKKAKGAEAAEDDKVNQLVQLGSDGDDKKDGDKKDGDKKDEEKKDDQDKEDKEDEQTKDDKKSTNATPAATNTGPVPKNLRPSYTFETLEDGLPPDWKNALQKEFTLPYWKALKENLCKERDSKAEIFPLVADIFEAFWATPLDKLRVFLCGQDPYHDNGQAMGLAFSVQKGLKKLPPSLKNIYKELATDITGFTTPTHGDISSWATQGVFMLNTVLTVRAHKANSHEKYGWLKFTDAVVQLLKGREKIVWIVWGTPAAKKTGVIDASKNCIIKSVHPSPLSAHGGFFGSKPFSQTNAYLVKNGFKPIIWQV